MKKNQNKYIFFLGTFFSLIVLLSISCQNYNKQDRKKLKYYYEESEKYQLDLKPEIILKHEEKIKLFNKHVQTEYKGFDGELIMKLYVRDSSYFDIGLYSYRPSRNHISFEKFFFNYVDTVVFVQKYDTLKWNSQIEHFIKEYDHKLSILNKNYLFDQKIK